MTDLRPTPMDRAPNDPSAPLLGPGQWHCEAPVFRRGEVPAHVALIMDGNGRWANSRGLARTEGHRAGEYALMDTIAGAIDAGVRYLSVYTFSTENWKRSPSGACTCGGVGGDPSYGRASSTRWRRPTGQPRTARPSTSSCA